MAEVRQRLADLSGDDENLLWALRRKLFKELTYDERGKPISSVDTNNAGEKCHEAEALPGDLYCQLSDREAEP
jgi:hypothetical protein